MDSDQPSWYSSALSTTGSLSGSRAFVRRSTMAQVVANLESQRRQYDLAGTARAAGFASVAVIDDDLGWS